MIRRETRPEYGPGSLGLLPIAAAVPALLLGPLPARATVLPEPPLAYRDTADNARALLIGLFTVGWQAESTATTTPDSR